MRTLLYTSVILRLWYKYIYIYTFCRLYTSDEVMNNAFKMNGATAFSLISYNPRHLFIPIYFKLVTESEIYHAQVFFNEISTRTIIIDEIIFLSFLRVNVKRVLLIILKGFSCFFYYVLLK